MARKQTQTIAGLTAGVPDRIDGAFILDLAMAYQTEKPPLLTPGFGPDIATVAKELAQAVNSGRRADYLLAKLIHVCGWEYA